MSYTTIRYIARNTFNRQDSLTSFSLFIRAENYIIIEFSMSIQIDGMFKLSVGKRLLYHVIRRFFCNLYRPHFFQFTHKIYQCYTIQKIYVQTTPRSTPICPISSMKFNQKKKFYRLIPNNPMWSCLYPLSNF